MIQKGLFVIFTFATTIVLCTTLVNFALFMSSQSVIVKDTDSSTFLLFTIDVCLVVMFMLQHSGMASGFYRSIMVSLGLEPLTRTIFCLATAFVLQVLMWLWQPIFEVRFWYVDTSDRPLLWLFFIILHCVLWIGLLLQVLVMEPLYLTGVKQIYHYTQGWYPTSSQLPPMLQTLLKHYPHPGTSCLVAILWLHPCMTFDRMILATVLTPYLCCNLSVTEIDYSYVQGCTRGVKVKTTRSLRSHKVY